MQGRIQLWHQGRSGQIVVVVIITLCLIILIIVWPSHPSRGCHDPHEPPWISPCVCVCNVVCTVKYLLCFKHFTCVYYRSRSFYTSPCWVQHSFYFLAMYCSGSFASTVSHLHTLTEGEIKAILLFLKMLQVFMEIKFSPLRINSVWWNREQ